MHKQNGMALLVVLLLLAVMVTMASSMTSRYRMEWLRTYNQQIQMQHYWYLVGTESLISKVLKQDFNDNPNKNSLAQYWAVEGQVFPVENANVQGVVRDAQACFNLNALRDTGEESSSSEAMYRADVFSHLLMNLNVDEYQAQQITSAIQDWLDSNTSARPLGAEDSEYESLTPPYLPANSLMADVSELRAIKGVSAIIYRRLLPYICVIPERTLQVDINTLRITQAPLLSALFLNTVNTTDAQTLLSNRPQEGWDSVDKFLQENAIPNTPMNSQTGKSLAVKSSYFLATLQAESEGNTTRLISLFQRQSNNQFIVIRRHFGGLE